MKKYYFFLLTILVVGCSDSSHFIEMNLPIKNPTSYIFYFSRDTLITELIKFTKNWKANSMHTDYLKKGEERIFKIPDSLNYLSKEDYFLIYELDPFPPRSRMYLSEKGEPIPYYARYIIRVISKSPSASEIQILTFQNYVLLGEKGGSKFLKYVFAADVRGLVTRYVPISTIEEYEILLKIGKYLGVEKDMPPLKVADRSKLEFHY